MLRKKFCDILHKVQQSSSCHQKYRQILINLYNETPFDDFEAEFMRCVENLFGIEIKHKNIYAERCMEFFSTFVATLVTNTNKKRDNVGNDSEDDIEIHPFLNAVVYNVLQYHNLEEVSVRFRCCQFINLLLRHLGDDAHVDSDMANAIQNAMLERVVDTKANIRLQAVKALVRLQQPDDPECPVVEALLARMHESNAQVRKEVVDSIAVIPPIAQKIVERVRDCDSKVRLSAFRKCSVMGPKLISITNRQLVIDSGFTEDHGLVKTFFLEDTLPNWLKVYDGDYLLLLNALKLDAYEDDLKQTEIISKKVLEVFFKSHSLESLLEYLPIDENKLVSIAKLNSETALYWCILTDFLRQSEDNEEHLAEIIPELLHFCTYIERYYEESKKKNLRDWQYLEYQQVLCQLLKIVKEYDFCDEVGRKAIQKLLGYMLVDGKFNICVITEIIFIMEKITPAFDSLTIDICHIISDIHEPLIETPPSEDTIRQNNFKVAELKVKINILTEDRDDAVAAADYERASEIKKQLIELKKKVEELMTSAEPPKSVRSTQNDPDTLCRCLNILIGVLSHPNLKSLTTSLRSCKDEFVTPLLSSTNLEVFSKAFKCIALCCLLDKQMAHDNLKLLCSPIIAYRIMPHYDKASLLISISAFSDVLRSFGTDIFNNGENSDSNLLSQTTNKRRLNATRRLYTNAQLTDMDSCDFEVTTCQDIIDLLLDMMDDENQELREHTGRALCELVKSRIAVSVNLISRIILKWFNPLTEKHDQKLQQLLAHAIVFFAQFVKDSEDILEQAVIPILTSLGNAPRASPLADVDIDSAISFLAAITSIQKPTGFNNIHKNLAFALCNKIAPQPENKCVPLYIKMLLNLDPILEDAVVVNELVNQAQLIVEDIIDRGSKRNLQKFIVSLTTALAEIRSNPIQENVENGSNRTLRHSLPAEQNSAQENNQNIRRHSNEPDYRSVEDHGASQNPSLTLAVEQDYASSKNVNPSDDGQIASTTNKILKVCLSRLPQVILKENNGKRNNGRHSKPTNPKIDELNNTKNSAQLIESQRRTSTRKSSILNSSDETLLRTIIDDSSPKVRSFDDDDMTIRSINTTSSSSNDSAGLRRLRSSKSDVTNSDNSLNTNTQKTPPIMKSVKRRKRRSNKNENHPDVEVQSSISTSSSGESTELRRGRSRNVVITDTSSESEHKNSPGRRLQKNPRRESFK